MDAMHPDAAQHPAQSRASVAALWAGSQTRSGAAIHDEGQRRDLSCLSRISLDRRRGQLEDIR
jgi:hypothetical protein